MSKTFSRGDRVRYTGKYWRDSVGPAIGIVGTVLSVRTDPRNPKDGNVEVSWDDVREAGRSAGGYLPGNLELISEVVQEKDTAIEAPEAAYGRKVDQLLHRYAERLHKNVEHETMVYPYSYLGVFAEFLREFEGISKP